MRLGGATVFQTTIMIFIAFAVMIFQAIADASKMVSQYVDPKLFFIIPAVVCIVAISIMELLKNNNTKP